MFYGSFMAGCQGQHVTRSIEQVVTVVLVSLHLLQLDSTNLIFFVANRAVAYYLDNLLLFCTQQVVTRSIEQVVTTMLLPSDLLQVVLIANLIFFVANRAVAQLATVLHATSCDKFGSRNVVAA